VDEEMDETTPPTTSQQSGDDRKQRSWVGNRRLFLGFAAIGVGVLGYATYLTYNNAKRFSSHLLTSPLTSSSATSLTASSLTSTPSLTSSSLTSTSKELVSLEGELYIGWDGSGVKQEGMPPLSDEKMLLASLGGTIFAQTTSDSSGHWRIDNIPTGDYLLYSEAGNKPRIPEFRYMCQSNKDFAPVGGTIPVGGGNYNAGFLGAHKLSLNESQEMNFEFSHGFLTLPFPKGIPIKINADVDENNGKCGDWMGSYCGMPNEQGIDFGMPVGTPVVAAAPGEVIFITDNRPGIGIGVTISHHEFTRLDALSTHYDCMSEVEVSKSQEVYRGQRIGLSGYPSGPHLHFELNLPGSTPTGIGTLIARDPYASLWNPNYALGYWTKINDPQFSV
jgi:hypothetical protein